MNVDKVKFNNIQNARAPKRSSVPNFTSAPKALYMTEKAFTEEIKQVLPPFIKGMKKLNENMGEVQNIFINALGTGLVAPIFIKWNPLSKTEEDTRTYSAWRQPVSAVLAVITQAGITIPVNRIVERMANNGYYDEAYNKTLFQDKSFIRKKTKKQFPNLTKDEFEIKVAAKIKEQEDGLLRMIRENKIVFTNHEGKAIPMKKANYLALINETVSKRLKHEEAELLKCTETRIKLKVKRGEYYRTHPNSLAIFEDINNRLAKTEDPKDVKKYIKSLRKQHKNGDKELLTIFEEILDRHGNTKAELKIAMQDKLTSMLDNIKVYSKCKSEKDVVKVVSDIVGVRMGEIEEAKSLLKAIQNAIAENKTVADIENIIENTVKQAKDAGKKHRLFDLRFADEVAELFKKKILNNIKGHKQIEGLIVSLAMLPVTCTLLNWVYPRFMDAVFPNLSHKKHPKEIKNLADKACQKAEVRS